MNSLTAMLRPLGAMLGRLFSSFSGGKSMVGLLGYPMVVSVVLPMTQLRLAADQFNVLHGSG